jgi:hypothetical protein
VSYHQNRGTGGINGNNAVLVPILYSYARGAKKHFGVPRVRRTTAITPLADAGQQSKAARRTPMRREE